jgi:hypothetical protein
VRNVRVAVESVTIPAPAHLSVTGFRFLFLCIVVDARKRDKTFHCAQAIDEGSREI